jgi:hypothetical protein
MSGGPLDDPRLQEVEACLNDGRFEEAQRKLVALGSVQALGPGVAYLTTRLLAQRGRLDAAAIAERINELLAEAPDFPEARNYLNSVRPPAAATHALAHAPTLSGALGPQGGHVVTAPRASASPDATSLRSAGPVVSVPAPDPLASVPSPGPLVSLASPTAPTAPSPRASKAPGARGARPSVLETPRVPGPIVHAAPRAVIRDLGTLEPPRSEVPTEPAPPPSEPASLEMPRFEPEPPSTAGRGIWDAVELDLASGRVEAALSALEKQAGKRLDQLVQKRMPELDVIAEHAADFLATSPITAHFPAYDLSLGSLARLDAALALFARRPQRGPRYALSVLLSAYVGECVRRASGGRWQGRLAEPDMATIERPRGETYQPWRAVHQALMDGRPIRVAASAGRSSPDTPERPRRPPDPPSVWAPAAWPDFSLFQQMGRVVPSSVLGTWSARIVQVPLDRSVASLSAIDQYLGLLAASALPVEASGGWARRAAVLAGAYLGEVLCLNAGARWSENGDAPPGPLRFELITTDGGAAYPVLWTLERLRGQAAGSVADRARSLLTA